MCFIAQVAEEWADIFYSAEIITSLHFFAPLIFQGQEWWLEFSLYASYTSKMKPF
jgi:hypothetical protein